MNKKVLAIVGIVIALVVVVILLTPKNRKELLGTKTSETPTMSLEERLKSDDGILERFVKSGEGERFPIYEAVLRLSRMRKPVAMQAAIKMADSDDKLWREGAAQALGAYSEQEALDALMKLTTDPEETVRTNAFQNMGKAKTPERAAHIKEMLNNKSMKDEVRVELLTSFYIASEVAKEKEWAQQELMKLARAKDENTASKATLKLVQVASRHKETLNLLQEKIKKSKDERVIAQSVRILSTQKDPWLLQNIKEMLFHESTLVRKTAIQSMSRSCPQQRWDLLSEVREKEKDRSVLDTLVREASLLSGPAAVNFLKKMQEKSLPDRTKQLVDDSLVKLGAKPNPGPCG